MLSAGEHAHKFGQREVEVIQDIMIQNTVGLSVDACAKANMCAAVFCSWD